MNVDTCEKLYTLHLKVYYMQIIAQKYILKKCKHHFSDHFSKD